MPAGRNLIFRIEPDITDLVMAGAGVPAGIGVGREAESTQLPYALPRRLNEGGPPVRSHPCNLGFAGGIDADEFLEGPSQRAVSGDVEIKCVGPHRVGAESG